MVAIGHLQSTINRNEVPSIPQFIFSTIHNSSLMVNMAQQKNFFPFQSPEVRVVEASAGSGKTFALAKRYVQLLIVSSNEEVGLKSILAITFTNKAAVEMKARILEFLKRIALGNLSPVERDEIIIPLGLSEKEAGLRAYAVMEGLIRNYNFFQVQTIDSFINALLCGCSFKINLSSNFKIKRNSHEYISVALDRLIDRARRDKDVRRAFQQFLHQYLFIENRSGWFPKKDLFKILDSMFNQSNFFSLDFLAGENHGDDLFLKKKSILKLMQNLRGILPENTHATFAKKLPEFLKEHSDSFDIDDLSDYFHREDFPATKGQAISDDIEQNWKMIRRELKSLCEMEAATLFNSYIDVFQMTLEEFRALAVKEDVLFLEELNKKARSLFDEGHVTVEELYYRLATRFHHYMIDEFQDTSRLQWENLALMVEEALSTGGSLFYVGDKKQAIYGFRGGDSLLFDELKDRFSVFNVHEEVLANNWRSRRAIVEFNNVVFGLENLQRFIDVKQEYEQEKNKKNAVVFSDLDFNEIRHVFANAQQHARVDFEGGLVRVERLDTDKKEERDDVCRLKILDLLKDIRGRYSLSDIAILTRNNSDVETITGWLLEEGINVRSERTSNIKNNKTIQDIEAFLRFLDSPIDNVSFSNFIIGETFARAADIRSSVFHDFIFELRGRISKDTAFYVYREFRERFPDLWERFFDDFFKNVGLYPLYEFTVNLIERLRIIENFPGDRGFVMQFLSVIKNQEKEHGDLSTFLEYFNEPLPEDLFVVVRGYDAIRILTIHKAKGLEFPVVILPSLEMDVKVGAGGKDGQQSFVAVHTGQGISLIRLKDKYRNFSPKLDELYAKEYKHSFLSELNNIYVALTRAVSELYIFIPSKAGSGYNPAQFLIPEDHFSVGHPVSIEKKAKGDVSLVEVVPSLSRDWMGFLREEFSESAFNLKDARRQGEIMHYVLAFLGNLDKVGMDDNLNRACYSVAVEFPTFLDWQILDKEVRRLVETAPIRTFFYTADCEVFCEREIVDALGETKRVDRMIIGKDSIDIIDFKSSKEGQPAHEHQVRNYMKLAASLYPSKKVQGWLVYWNDRSLEQVLL